MSDRRRWIGCTVGALLIAAAASTLGASAAAQVDPAPGCRGLSPASAEGCTPDELRAALDQDR